MLNISKNQKDYLENNGCTFGEELHTTHSRYHHYYATETAKVKSLLKRYENEIKPKN